MRKKLTLTIDERAYEMIKDLPRTVSVSEFVSFVIKAMYKDIKKGRELNQAEFDKWMESDPKLRDFRERFKEHWGPTFYKVEDAINGIKEKVKPKRKKK